MKISGPSFSKPVAFASILVAAAGIVAFNSPIRSFLTLSVSSPNSEVRGKGILRVAVDPIGVEYHASESCPSCRLGPLTSQQGPLNPTLATNSTITCPPPGCRNWTSVNFIENGSNTGAYISTLGGSSATSQFAIGSAFGFSIPSGATITGITFTVGTLANGTINLGVFTNTNAVRMVKAGTPTGTTKGPGPNYGGGTTFHDETWGSSSDLWGTTWTPSDINSAGFGVELQGFVNAIECTRCGATYYARINNFRLTVTYSGALGGINYFYIAGSDGTLVGPCLVSDCSFSEPLLSTNTALAGG